MRWPPIIATLLIAGLLVGSLCCQPQQPPGERPNIILVIGDDHGYRDFGFMGSDIAITPRLDGLAKSGTLFTHGYTTASACQPSLRTLLTGLQPLEYSSRTRPLGATDVEAEQSIRRVATLPRILSAHGYSTFQSGKHWEGTFADAGFDEGMMAVAGKEGQEKSNRILREGLEPVLDFIDRDRDGPFFVWFAPNLPHQPHDPPAEFIRPYLRSDLPIDVVTYYGAVSWFDAGLGRLLDHLDQTGIREETLVVYLSDNGWEEVTLTGDDVRAYRHQKSMGGPSGKMSLYDTGFRTPVIFDWPGRIPAERTVETLVSLVDLFPTLLSFAGIDAPPNRSGRDLRSVIDGSQPLEHRAIVGMMEKIRPDMRSGKRVSKELSVPGGHFYRDETWHYIEYFTRPAELYRVIDDPNELDNVAAEMPRFVERFSAEIAAWDQRMRKRVPPDPFTDFAR